MKKGRVSVLGKSAGQRNLHLVSYGQKDSLASTVNYNSACGGEDPASYRRKDGKQKPVVLLLGPEHGGEIEGIVGLNNHSHESSPSVEPTAYVPRTVKETIRALADRLYARYRAAGLPAREAGPEVQEDGVTFPPPSFNLASALHHTSGGAAFIHECTAGARYKSAPEVTHEQILDLEMVLYDELLRFAVERSVRWIPSSKSS